MRMTPSFADRPVASSGARALRPHARAIELFFWLYYVITGFHSVHVIIGVTLILVLAVRVARGAFGPRHYTALELTALYWHLVDIVWIFVYPIIYLVGRSG